MSRRTPVSITALVVCLGMFATAPISAQSSPSLDKPSVSEHHQGEHQLMQDMSQEMNKMTEEMSRGELTIQQRKDMSQRMERMSNMMHSMAALSGPAMRDPESEKKMDQLRREMDQMMRAQPMQSSAK